MIQQAQVTIASRRFDPDGNIRVNLAGLPEKDDYAMSLCPESY